MGLQPEVHTSRFHVRRELWHIQDWVLPAPVPLIPAAVFAAVIFIEFKLGVADLLGHLLPFPMNLIPIVVVAYGFWRVSDRPTVEGKTLQAYIASQLRFWFTEPKKLVGFEPAREPFRARLRLGSTWSHKP